MIDTSHSNDGIPLTDGSFPATNLFVSYNNVKQALCSAEPRSKNEPTYLRGAISEWPFTIGYLSSNDKASEYLALIDVDNSILQNTQFVSLFS